MNNMNGKQTLRRIGDVQMASGQIVPLMEIKWMSDEQWRALTETEENLAMLAARGYQVQKG